MKYATDRPMHQVWFAQSSSPASHCLVFAFALVTSSTPCETPLRSCTLNTQIMHFGHTSFFLSALCYSFVAWFLSSPLPASTFATSSAQIETSSSSRPTGLFFQFISILSEIQQILMQFNSNGGCNLITASSLHQLWFDCLQCVIRVLRNSELPASDTSDTSFMFSDFRF